MNRIGDDRYSGKCSKHGVWVSNYMDECPKCAAEDYYTENEAEAIRSGICGRCKYYTSSVMKCCDHPKRRDFPTKPRKRKCILFKQWISVGKVS